MAFYKSPQIWRITRYRFFHLPMDRSGPYIYVQDAKTGGYWCPTSEPASDKPEEWKSAHGMGYTRFEAKRAGIAASDGVFCRAIRELADLESNLVQLCAV